MTVIPPRERTRHVARFLVQVEFGTECRFYAPLFVRDLRIHAATLAQHHTYAGQPTVTVAVEP